MIGRSRSALMSPTADEEERYVRYKPPTVEGFGKSNSIGKDIPEKLFYHKFAQFDLPCTLFPYWYRKIK